MRYIIALIALTALYSCRTQNITKEVKVTIHDTIYVDSSTVDTIIEPCKDSVVVVENERVIVKFERLPNGKAKLTGTAKADTIYRVKEVPVLVEVKCPQFGWFEWWQMGWYVVGIAFSFGFFFAYLRQ